MQRRTPCWQIRDYSAIQIDYARFFQRPNTVRSNNHQAPANATNTEQTGT
jgi:hypothetical protein